MLSHTRRGLRSKVGAALASPTLLPLLPLLAVLAVLLPLLAGCDRAPPPAPPDAAEAGSGFPELGDLHALVSETRGILPRIPAGIKPQGLRSRKASPREPGAQDSSAPREVLRGSGTLLRSTSHPGLPRSLDAAVFLTDPGQDGAAGDSADGAPLGYVLLRPPRGTAQRWPVLSAHREGSRSGAFAHTLRLRSPEWRLGYLVLLGVPFNSEGAGYRALEGYLVLPSEERGPEVDQTGVQAGVQAGVQGGGGFSAAAALYPLDFGYRHPEPPTVTLRARQLTAGVAQIGAALERRSALSAQVQRLREDADRLRASKLSEKQEQSRRDDLKDYERRIRSAQAEIDAAERSLHEGLLALYRGRAAASADWQAFADSNAYRWRSPAERDGVYQPLRDFRGHYPLLERAYTALGGDANATLHTLREAMEQAVLAEEEGAPEGGSPTGSSTGAQ